MTHEILVDNENTHFSENSIIKEAVANVYETALNIYSNFPSFMRSFILSFDAEFLRYE